MVHQTLSTLLQPSAVKSMWTCHDTLSEEPPDKFQLLAVKYRRLLAFVVRLVETPPCYRRRPASP